MWEKLRNNQITHYPQNGKDFLEKYPPIQSAECGQARLLGNCSNVESVRLSMVRKHLEDFMSQVFTEKEMH